MAEQKGIGAKFAGHTVEYIGPGRQHNGTIPDPEATPRRGMSGRPGVASGRLPKGRAREVSPHVASVAAKHPDKFIVRDASGKPVNE